jgi:serine/threonine protein kinase
MGALYLAVAGDRGLERLMVIKTVLPHLADTEYIARFRDEAKVVVKLSHGNLIPVFDAGQVEGELFLAMDFVEGRDLRAVWNRCAKKQVAFPIDIAVYIVKELCRGLAYAHAFPDLELVHRDISPPNILISYTGEVKLTDFGLASSTLKLEKTAPGIIYGKVAYMSPEQARGEKLDGRSDMYASGIVLWELLTGRQLFPPGKEQPQDLLTRAKNPDVLRPSKRAPRVPVELDEVCLRSLASDRADRYATCDDMQKALQTWLAGNAPTTDQGRMAAFLQELFAEDIARERGEREAMMSTVRTRALTLPPTDELRQMIENSAGFEVPGAPTVPPVRQPGSIGRRAADRGDLGNDRRRAADRRAAEGRALAAASALALDQSDTDMGDLRGQIVDGRYRIDELIGEGGMGKVYAAEHVEIGKRVAVKVLHPSYGRMPDLVERFRREARAASKIGHPHIVDVTDSGTTPDGSVYFVMEYLEGVELGAVIEREGALDMARTLRIATQICRALAAAHSSGIIHRDLKPENVFLTIRDGGADFVKVLDFGIAKTTEAEEARDRRLTSPGMAMGTPEYMAPEQAAGRPADERCDVYALGAILYEMLTGVPPYQGDNFMEILTKKATVDPVSPAALRSTIPEAVSTLVMRAMSRDPDNRPPSMEAFEYEITKCLAGRGAAVAQILGMTTDATLVASMNPGLSVRMFDGAVVGRSSPSINLSGLAAGIAPTQHQTPPSNPMIALAATAGLGQVAMGAGGGLALTSPGFTARPSLGPAGMLNAPANIAFDTEFSDATAMVQPLGSVKVSGGSGMFGWLLLAAALFGGVGVVLYVALGERHGMSARESAAADAAALAGSAAPPDAATPMLTVPSDAGAHAPPPADAGVPEDNHGEAHGEPEVREPNSNGSGASTRPDRIKPDRPDKPEGRPTAGVPRTEKEASALLVEARSAASALRWPEARDAFGRIAQGKFYRGQGLLGQAKVAWETKDVDGAITLADQALAAGAGDAARVLLGHAYYKKADFARALSYYDAVLKHNPNDAEAKRSAELVRAKLGGR